MLTQVAQHRPITFAQSNLGPTWVKIGPKWHKSLNMPNIGLTQLQMGPDVGRCWAYMSVIGFVEKGGSICFSDRNEGMLALLYTDLDRRIKIPQPDVERSCRCI